MPKHVKKKKNPHAVALGRLGGLKGGPATAKMLGPEGRKRSAQHAAAARAKKLSPERRKRMAQLAALARWSRR